MAGIQKPVTKITEYEERDVTFRELEILPEQFQTRARTDMKVVNIYSRAMADGSKFPAVVVFRTPDGRLVLADGFHRVKARQSLGFKNVRAVIRPGTEQDAILFGIGANLDEENIRKVTPDDRMHAVKIMIRDPEFRVWSNSEINRRTGVSEGTIIRLRLELRDGEGIPVPEKVKKFSKGKPTGDWCRHRMATVKNGGAPAIFRIPSSEQKGEIYGAQVGGKTIKARGNQEVASARIAEKIEKARESQEVGLAVLRGGQGGVVEYFRRRGVGVVTDQKIRTGAFFCGDSICIGVPDTGHQSVALAVGLGVLTRAARPDTKRLILIGYFSGDSHVTYLVNLASQLTPPIEFMTPEELVAEFGSGGVDGQLIEAPDEGV